MFTSQLEKPLNTVNPVTTPITTTSHISPEQDPQRLREAQELLGQLQSILSGDVTADLSNLPSVLTKAEEFSNRASRQPNLDTDTRKCLEDISALLFSGRRLGISKDLADRLQTIYDESQKALESTRGVDVSAAAKEATQNVVDFVDNWRPLFYLLMSSRDFRQMLLDLNRIVQKIAYSYVEPIKEETEQQFVEGAPAQEMAQTVKDRVQQKGAPELSDEEWNTIQDDLQRVLAVLAREPTYRQGIERLFILLDMFQKSLVPADPVLGNPVVPENIHVRRVVKETEKLVAAFSAKGTLEEFKFNLRNLIINIQFNQELQNYLSELKMFILKAKSESEIRSEEFKIESKALARRGRELVRQFKEEDEELKLFLDSADKLVENIKNDQCLQILRHHAGIVQSDLSYVDTDGQVRVDTDMLSKLQSAVLPVLADALKYIPVTRIESSDYYRHFWLDNIILCSYDVVPDNIRFHLETDSQVSMKDSQQTGTRTCLIIELSGLRTELKDVEFFYAKKSFGYKVLEERGRATFRVKGDGAKLRFTYLLVQGQNDPIPRISEGFANFDISELEVEFDQSTLKHTVLIPAISQLYISKIKEDVERHVENNLNAFIERMGDMMTKTLSQVNRPIMTGIEMAKNAVKSSQIAQVVSERKEILE